MVFGDPNHERIVLNEHTLWPGGEQDADKEDAYKYLPKIQKLFGISENEDYEITPKNLSKFLKPHFKPHLK